MVSSLAARVAMASRQQPLPHQQPQPQPQPAPMPPPPPPVDPDEPSAASASGSSDLIPAAAGAAVDPETAELFSGLVTASRHLRSSSAAIAYYGIRLRERDSWRSLGFESEADCCNQLGIQPATWRTAMLLGNRLRNLTLVQLSSISHKSMMALARIDKTLWREFAWIEEARQLPAYEFAALVNQRSQERGLKLAAPTGNISISIPASSHSRMLLRMNRVKVRYGMNSLSEVLDRVIAASEREEDMAEQVEVLLEHINLLARLWSPDAPWSAGMQESLAARDARMRGDEAPRDLEDAAAASQRLVRKLVRAAKGIRRMARADGEPRERERGKKTQATAVATATTVAVAAVASVAAAESVATPASSSSGMA